MTSIPNDDASEQLAEQIQLLAVSMDSGSWRVSCEGKGIHPAKALLLQGAFRLQRDDPGEALITIIRIVANFSLEEGEEGAIRQITDLGLHSLLDALPCQDSGGSSLLSIAKESLTATDEFSVEGVRDLAGCKIQASISAGAKTSQGRTAKIKVSYRDHSSVISPELVTLLSFLRRIRTVEVGANPTLYAKLKESVSQRLAEIQTPSNVEISSVMAEERPADPLFIEQDGEEDTVNLSGNQLGNETSHQVERASEMPLVSLREENASVDAEVKVEIQNLVLAAIHRSPWRGPDSHIVVSGWLPRWIRSQLREKKEQIYLTMEILNTKMAFSVTLSRGFVFGRWQANRIPATAP